MKYREFIYYLSQHAWVTTVAKSAGVVLITTYCSVSIRKSSSLSLSDIVKSVHKSVLSVYATLRQKKIM